MDALIGTVLGLTIVVVVMGGFTLLVRWIDKK